MIGYVDSSIFLRVLLNQKNSLKEFRELARPVASLLLKAEVLRTIDRLRVSGQINEDQFVSLTAQAYEAFASIEFIRLTDTIVSGAGASLPIALGTLDAIHLVSAMIWRNSQKLELNFLTHDERLGKAARASGFVVLGC
ncbi:MAG TPA: type II toxin-antitoxin system VapC family toxin [Bdellovibrionales bacterium]|nr:type II toxin-antitoxin system VapC family toxin [Bdellovibrionales bacterium]